MNFIPPFNLNNIAASRILHSAIQNIIHLLPCKNHPCVFILFLAQLGLTCHRLVKMFTQIG
jgi:hypothetical protein